MTLKKITILWLILQSILLNFRTFSQESPDGLRKNSINLFIDCDYCDQAHIKKEINYVNYVRETQDAHVYILMTYQSTGSGGDAFSILFKGQREFSGQNDTLTLITEKYNTFSEIRDMQINTIKIGLLHYLAQTPLANYFSIDYSKPAPLKVDIKDKWNKWIFNFSTNGYFNGEKLYRMNYFWGSLSANRTTEKLKISNRFSADYEIDIFPKDDINNEQISYNFTNYTAFVLNPHWSAGYRFDLGSSIYSNLNVNFSLFPAIEFNILPFSESTRKLFVFDYWVGSKFNKYNDTTIYNKTHELLFQQNMAITYSIIEKWGSIYTRIIGSNYFHDFSKNFLSINSRINFRIFKGLSVNFSVGASLIHDQLSLVKGITTTDELLLRQHELETNFRYWSSFGINIQFGSIFNNAVNMRFNSMDAENGSF